MKTLQYITLGFIFLISSQSNTETTEFQSGDIIFQTSTSGLSKVIQIATDSKYSHMGIIYKQEDEFFVYEAVQPAKLTPLGENNQWYKSSEYTDN